MTMSRCGKRYVTMQSAVLAAELRTSKGAKPLAVVSCALGDHWHLVPPASVTGQGAWAKSDPFPPMVAAALDRRDLHCQGCGKGARLERHHRRAKSMGGSSARSHTQCACNGLKLCRRCHAWAHEHPAEARVLGWIVRQAVSRPGAVVVQRYAKSELAWVDDFWPTCDGQWVHSPLETEN